MANERLRLREFTTGDFSRGVSSGKEAAWWVVKMLFFLGAFPWPSALRVALLRAFGATVGERCVVRSRVNVTFPWRLRLGDDVWIGEEVLILSLAEVTVENDVCISQRAFLCTGSHDFSKATFDLITRPIVIRSGSWIAAGAFVAPGVEIGPDAMLTAGSVASRNVPPGMIAAGNPAVPVKRRGENSL